MIELSIKEQMNLNGGYTGWWVIDATTGHTFKYAFENYNDAKAAYVDLVGRGHDVRIISHQY